MSYSEIASQVKELSAEKERLLQEVGDLQVKEGRASELRQEIEDMELATRIFPFLSDPDKVVDDDFSLISIVVNCVDKWLVTQPELGPSWTLRWDDVKRHVQSKRNELG